MTMFLFLLFLQADELYNNDISSEAAVRYGQPLSDIRISAPGTFAAASGYGSGGRHRYKDAIDLTGIKTGKDMYLSRTLCTGCSHLIRYYRFLLET